jgi:hypothetical protein
MEDLDGARAASLAVAAGFGLDDLVVYNRRGPLTLRWGLLRSTNVVS